MARKKRHKGDTDTFNTIIKSSVKETLVYEYRKEKLYGNDIIEFLVEILLPYVPLELLLKYKKDNNSIDDFDIKKIFSEYLNSVDLSEGMDKSIEVKNEIHVSDSEDSNIPKDKEIITKQDDFSNAIESLHSLSKDKLNL